MARNFLKWTTRENQSNIHPLCIRTLQSHIAPGKEFAQLHTKWHSVRISLYSKKINRLNTLFGVAGAPGGRGGFGRGGGRGGRGGDRGGRGGARGGRT